MVFHERHLELANVSKQMPDEPTSPFRDRNIYQKSFCNLKINQMRSMDTTTNAWAFHCIPTVYVGINPYAREQQAANRCWGGWGLQQATILSCKGRVVVGVGGCRPKSQLGRSSYHVNLAFRSHGGQLDVPAGCLDGFVRGQESSSVD